MMHTPLQFLEASVWTALSWVYRMCILVQVTVD